MRSRHRAWAEIDLDAFRANLNAARQVAGPAQVWPVLKANAYGHGARTLARVCEAARVDRIGVGDSSEALELRGLGIQSPLLVLGTIIDAEVDALLDHGIEVGVHSEGRAQGLGEFARRQSTVLGVHLKIDVGMTRLGVLPSAALRVAKVIDAHPSLRLCGVMTHYPAQDGCLNPRTAEQHQLFLTLVQQLREAGVRVPATHSANSAALFSGLQPLGDAVRPGISLFGVLPPALSTIPLQPVLSLHAQVVFLKDIPAGRSVGYGGRWVAHRDTRLATLPMGYADGVPYRLGNSGQASVLVRGVRCPMVGAVSMDYCTVDVGHVPGVEVGDTATLIGKNGSDEIGVQEVADAAGTIPYEITCSLGPRVRRVYRGDSAAPRTTHPPASLPN